MKRFFFLVLASCLLLPLQAFEDEKFYQFIDMDFTYNTGDDAPDVLIDYNNSFEVNYGILYSFNNYVQVGGGIGLNAVYSKKIIDLTQNLKDEYNTTLMPVFFRGQVNLYDNEVVIPFLVLDFGYDFMLWEEGSNSDYYVYFNKSYYKAGFTFTPHIALSVLNEGDSNVMFNLGYRMHFINASQDYNINSLFVGITTTF